MARIRTVKPEMSQDEDLASCSIEAQLLAVRVLNHCDDEGFFKAHPALIKSNCFPLMDFDSMTIHGLISELSNIGYFSVCEGTDGKQYGHVTNFLSHQVISRAKPSKIKALAIFTDESMIDHGFVHAGMEWNGKEGNREGNSSCADSGESDETKSKYKFEHGDMWLAEVMRELIYSVTNDETEPNYQSWANDIRLMRERDNRDPKEMLEVFQWANSDSFWCTNILSPSKFRKQYIQLKAKMNENTQRPKPGNTGRLSAVGEVRAARERQQTEGDGEVVATMGGDE